MDQPPKFQEVRPGIEPGPPPYRGGVLPEHLQTICVSDPGWSRTSTFLHVTQASSPLDHGTMSVTEAGVEPATSPGSRPGRFACLRTRPWRVRVSHPAGEAHETSLSAGPPASSCRPRYRAGHTGHDQPSVGARGQLGACQACNSSQRGDLHSHALAGTTF